jgi:hypothetical protein
MRINVRFVIPSSQRDEHFKAALINAGFHVDAITPSEPRCGEIAAYNASGYYEGTWTDFFELCKRVASCEKFDGLTCNIE